MSEIDPAIEARARDSFGRQTLMLTIGARMTKVAPGSASIEFDDADDIRQQHGFVHGGAVGMIADTACGYAALTLAPADCEVLTVEYKINFLLPAVGQRFVATGRVKRSGRRLSVVEGEVEAIDGDSRKTIALILATMAIVPVAE